MRRTRSISSWLVYLTLCPGPSQGDEAGPFRPEVSFGPGPYFVGQSIDLRVVVAGGEPIAVTAPKVAGGVVTTTGAAGRFRVVAERSGVLIIPPMAVRAGGRSGRTAPLRLTVRDLPAAGRPASFLGGVGELKAEAEARPVTIRVGEPIEFRVRLTGPGARGSTGRPTLSGQALKDLLIQVAPLPSEATDEPPTRVVRYRLRPGRAGEGTLPPVAVAYFDPKAERYFVRATSGIAIRVEQAPAFDPGGVRYVTTDGAGSARFAWMVVGSVGLGLGLSIYGIRGVMRRRGRVRSRPRALAAQLAGEIRGLGTGMVAARRITEALADYLAEATGGTVGALTPEEARRGIAGVSGDEALAGSAARVVTGCDEVRYGAAGEAPTADAAALFEALAGVTPKEAPRTAES